MKFLSDAFYMIKHSLLNLGSDLMTDTAVDSGDWTHTGRTVNAPGTASGSDTVVFTLSEPTKAGRDYLVEIPNDVPAVSFYVDLVGSDQVGGLSSSDTEVLLTNVSAKPTLRIGRWGGAPAGNIGPITIREQV